MSHPGPWQVTEGNLFPVVPILEEGARGYVQLRPSVFDGSAALPGQELEAFARAMWQQVRDHNPRYGDAYDILAIKTIASDRKPFVIEIDECLRISGVKPKKGGAGRRGGYESEQRRDMYQAVMGVANAELSITVERYEGERGKRRKMAREYTGRAYAVTDVAANVMLDGSRDVRAIYVTPGLAHGLHLVGPGRQVAMISAAIFRLDPYRQAPESFLGKYLSWLWKTQARSAGYARPHRVATLLENCHLETDAEKPILTLRRLEKALATLGAEGIIAGWRYSDMAPGTSWEERDRPAKGWAAEWLRATITIEPPAAIRAHYAPLERSAPAAITPQAGALGERLKATRARLKLSQAAAAEACELPQQSYSRAERTGSASRENRGKLEAWLSASSPPESE